MNMRFAASGRLSALHTWQNSVLGSENRVLVRGTAELCNREFRDHPETSNDMRCRCHESEVAEILEPRIACRFRMVCKKSGTGAGLIGVFKGPSNEGQSLGRRRTRAMPWLVHEEQRRPGVAQEIARMHGKPRQEQDRPAVVAGRAEHVGGERRTVCRNCGQRRGAGSGK